MKYRWPKCGYRKDDSPIAQRHNITEPEMLEEAVVVIGEEVQALKTLDVELPNSPIDRAQEIRNKRMNDRLGHIPFSLTENGFRRRVRKDSVKTSLHTVATNRS